MEHGREGGKYLNNFLTYNAQISVHSKQARDPVAEEQISPRAGIGRKETYKVAGRHLLLGQRHDWTVDRERQSPG